MLSLAISLISNLLLWLWLAAAAGLWLQTRGSRRRRWAAAGLAALWLLACRPVAELFLWPLESRYSQPAVADLAARGVRRVVVLTSGGLPPRGELAGSALTTGSAARFLGGMELCASLGSDCLLVFSGSAGRGHRDLATAEHMLQLAGRLAPRLRVEAETASGSTAEHPANVRSLVGGGPFALVTSAYHMPRAMRSFRLAGLEPVPFPVDFQALGRYAWDDWVPSFDGLRQLQTAWREYLALIFYRLRGT